MARSHRIESVLQIPCVISDSAEAMEKTSNAISLLKKIGACLDAKKAKDSQGCLILRRSREGCFCGGGAGGVWEEKGTSEYWRETEIRLMATAGLRMLEKGVQDRILEACRTVLRGSDFRFYDDWASVISGSDEGVYAWVVANYALGTVGGDPKQTTGIIELGGAAAQENKFLVMVIRDLLNLCEITKGKDNKVVIASNIM
nr:probable apyrase 2 isoform X1 [Coffea arabica]